jgi:hypothetical protein
MVASRFGWWFVAKAPCPTRAADAHPLKTEIPARRCYFAIGSSVFLLSLIQHYGEIDSIFTGYKFFRKREADDP